MLTEYGAMRINLEEKYFQARALSPQVCTLGKAVHKGLGTGFARNQ
jgi:hypothetical protein